MNTNQFPIFIENTATTSTWFTSLIANATNTFSVIINILNSCIQNWIKFSFWISKYVNLISYLSCCRLVSHFNWCICKRCTKLNDCQVIFISFEESFTVPVFYIIFTEFDVWSALVRNCINIVITFNIISYLTIIAIWNIFDKVMRNRQNEIFPDNDTTTKPCSAFNFDSRTVV